MPFLIGPIVDANNHHAGWWMLHIGPGNYYQGWGANLTLVTNARMHDAGANDNGPYLVA